MTTQDAAEAANTAAQAGSFVEKVASAGTPDRSTLARLGKGAAAVQVGARLLPAAWRFIKRYPVAGPIAVIAVVGVAYWMRVTRNAARPLA